MGGNGIYWQAPASEKTVFLFGIYPSYNTVSAQVYNRNSAKLKPFDTAHFQIVDAAGKVYSEAKVQKAGNKFYKEFHLPRLKDGKYFITGKLTGYNVKPEILEKHSFEYKRFPWEGNTIGLERVVIPPFKALSVNKDKTKVNATLTGYTFGKNLIEGVTAQGEEILTKPVTFSINGSNLALGKLNYTEIAPDRVRAKTSGKAGKFNVNVSYDIDYDGMIWVKMDIDGGKFGFIKDMRLEIPMKTEYARSLFAACARPRKHPNLILSDKMGVVFNSRTDTPKNFLSYVWFGEVYKGLCWFTETEKQWNYDPNKPTTQVIRKPDGSTVLVINMINRNTIQYLLVEARTRKAIPLGGAIPFSLSVKNYFGVHGKTIRQLYAFDDWHNKKLGLEMNRIWRTMDTQLRQRPERQTTRMVREIYDDERAA